MFEKIVKSTRDILQVNPFGILNNPNVPNLHRHRNWAMR